MRVIAVGLAALLFLTACGKKVPPAEVGPAPSAEESTESQDPSDVDLVELPAMQADLVAQAGSDTVYFDTDQFSLDMADMDILEAQARWLIEHPNLRASIEGHADERGTREYNLALAERRANSAREYLIAQGVPASRLLVTSWGKERPVALGSNEEAWAQNRRSVTLVVR
jgi:peptidoglycan-associated lipoprotein